MTNFINFITVGRIFLAPIILIFLIFGNYLICLLLFFLAGLTDYFDGYLARKYNAESQLGEILDPIADKILIVFILIGLSVDLDSFLIDYSSRNNSSHKTKVTYLAKIKTSVQIFSVGLYLFALAFSFNLLIIIGDIFLIVATLITLYTGYEYTLNVFKK